MQQYKRALFGRILIVLAIALAGCGRFGSTLPEEGPEAVTKRFYELITAAKIEGGTTSASEAYKMINLKISNMNLNNFLEIIKGYPPEFKVEVGKAEIKGTLALVDISYKLPSSFGGEYSMKQVVPLNIDSATNTWVIDFTGDTYGMQKDDAIAASKLEAPSTPAPASAPASTPTTRK